MRFRNSSSSSRGDGTPMSAMIDIVFLLLVFFVMTFQIVAMEGEFWMKAPVQKGQPGAVVDVPPVWIRLEAGDDGRLASIRVNGVAVANLDALRNEIIRMTSELRESGTGTDELEAVLDCDYGLAYDHVIQTIDAIRGYKDDAGNVVDLIQKIRFAPTRDI